MAFLPQEFAGAQEHARAHFPAHDIGPLVRQQRQIAPRLHPARHGRADHRFRRGAHDQRLFQLRLGIGHQPALAVGDQAVVRDDRHLLGEAFDMIGFLGEIGQRNEQREVAVLDARFLDARVHDLLDAFPDAIAPRLDHHAAAHARFLGQLGLGDHRLVPLGEVFVARDVQRVLDLGWFMPRGLSGNRQRGKTVCGGSAGSSPVISHRRPPPRDPLFRDLVQLLLHFGHLLAQFGQFVAFAGGGLFRFARGGARHEAAAAALNISMLRWASCASGLAPMLSSIALRSLFWFSRK
jgi:hypothetical protein